MEGYFFSQAIEVCGTWGGETFPDIVLFKSL